MEFAPVTLTTRGIAPWWMTGSGGVHGGCDLGGLWWVFRVADRRVILRRGWAKR